jgi:nitroreductase
MSSDRPVYESIRSRRAVRDFTDEPVSRGALERILRAARWAPSAGNRRLHKFVALEDAKAIARIKAISPGMFGEPPVLIVMCTDAEQLARENVKDHDTSTMVDVGTSAMCMMLAAHELGLGTCPTTSFSAGGIRGALNLPDHLTPDFMLQVGHAKPQPLGGGGGGTKLTIDEITHWGAYPSE